MNNRCRMRLNKNDNTYNQKNKIITGYNVYNIPFRIDISNPTFNKPNKRICKHLSYWNRCWGFSISLGTIVGGIMFISLSTIYYLKKDNVICKKDK